MEPEHAGSIGKTGDSKEKCGAKPLHIEDAQDAQRVIREKEGGGVVGR